MSEKLIITPKTKVLQLLENYPELEDYLISIVPAFKKLKNPVLRKTVARIATLQQAAAIGNIKTEELINQLRKQAGQDVFSEESGSRYNLARPAWFSPEKVTTTFDVREMLAAGEHPVAKVMDDLKKLEEGAVYELLAPFLPAPLIDKAVGLGADYWVVQDAEDVFRVYFVKHRVETPPATSV
ncbi:MAG TPA: DUF1858 domain-containing protein [Prolixibacteraceae bacterium]|nr:DUF1858 domain-containing protein [Prolixibacteraceae bacterium]